MCGLEKPNLNSRIARSLAAEDLPPPANPSYHLLVLIFKLVVVVEAAICCGQPLISFLKQQLAYRSTLCRLRHIGRSEMGITLGFIHILCITLWLLLIYPQFCANKKNQPEGWW